MPAGRFETGAIHLTSNINLHLHDDAVLSFYTDRAHYLPYVMTRWEGVELMGYSPLIYAYQQENIAITGKGILEGQEQLQRGVGSGNHQMAPVWNPTSTRLVPAKLPTKW